MSKKKSSRNNKWLFAAGAAVLILILLMIAWPKPGAQPGPPGDGWSSSSPSAAGKNITASQASQLRQAGAFLLDVRTVEEWQTGHIPGATLIPLDQLEARAGELPGNLPILIYCRSGNRSGQALTILEELGFSDLYTLEGGINKWISAGYEVEVGN